MRQENVFQLSAFRHNFKTSPAFRVVLKSLADEKTRNSNLECLYSEIDFLHLQNEKVPLYVIRYRMI